MEPQQPTVSPSPISPEPPKEVRNGSHWLPVASVTIFILLALSAVAYLYYQNQQLKSMLASYQPQVTATPIATPNPNIPIVSTPSANMKVVSPLKVSGTVPTGWMFEGVFPIKLVDVNQKVITQGQAKETVAGSWQSGNPVDFTATLTFKGATGSGNLTLENDNPSGDPTKAQTFEVPVDFQ
jgi:hypothetical protein